MSDEMLFIFAEHKIFSYCDDEIRLYFGPQPRGLPTHPAGIGQVHPEVRSALLSYLTGNRFVRVVFRIASFIPTRSGLEIHMVRCEPHIPEPAAITNPSHQPCVDRVIALLWDAARQ